MRWTGASNRLAFARATARSRATGATVGFSIGQPNEVKMVIIGFVESKANEFIKKDGIEDTVHGWGGMVRCSRGGRPSAMYDLSARCRRHVRGKLGLFVHFLWVATRSSRDRTELALFIAGEFRGNSFKENATVSLTALFHGKLMIRGRSGRPAPYQKAVNVLHPGDVWFHP
jgi:hypothetical protein